MEDNKEKQTKPGQKNQPENQSQPTPLDFGSAGMDDINKNVGHFGNNNQTQQQTPEIKLDVDAKVVDKAAKEEINFERFSKTKKERKQRKSAPKTRLGEKVAMMLRSKKGLIITWVLELVIMFLIIGLGIALIVWLTPYLKNDRVKILGPGGALQAGIVFFWISLFPGAIPLIYLITAWFIGINQVYSSKSFHLLFWLVLAISLICFIVGIGLSANTMHLIIANPAL